MMILEQYWGLGIFFGEILRKNIKDLDWTTEENKRMFNYGRPILKRPTSKMSIAPYFIMNTYASQVMRGKEDEDGVSKLYHIWKTSLEQY